jgi:hypothetical protein
MTLGKPCSIMIAGSARRRRRRAGLLGVGLVVTWLLLLAPSGARADSATFVPEADAYVSAVDPGENFGRAPTLQMGASPVTRSYLRFDVQLPAGAAVTGATLELYTTTIAPSAGFWAYAVADDSWDEEAIAYAGAPAFGGRLGWSGGFATIGYKSVALPASYVSDGLVSVGATTSSTYIKSFSSREGANTPRLVVSYTTGTPSPSPVPSASPSPAPPPTSGDPVVKAAGDIACEPGRSVSSSACQQKATSDLLSGATAVLTLGDNQYDDGSLSEFQQSFDASWGRFKDVMRPVPGNHEYQTSGAAGYFGYFGSRAAEPGKGWYSYDVGDWHLIALNTSNGCGSVSCSAGSAQEQWLKQDLAANDNQCTLAYWHHPRFSSGSHGSTSGYSAFWQDLYAAGADIVLNGHDHDYERFAPQDPSGKLDSARGIRQFVVGTGGKSRYSIGSTVPNSEAHNSNTFGVLELTLHDDSYDWRFVPAAGGNFTDSGSESCH